LVKDSKDFQGGPSPQSSGSFWATTRLRCKPSKYPCGTPIQPSLKLGCKQSQICAWHVACGYGDPMTWSIHIAVGQGALVVSKSLPRNSHVWYMSHIKENTKDDHALSAISWSIGTPTWRPTEWHRVYDRMW
jgi:hypothetical protein